MKRITLVYLLIFGLLVIFSGWDNNVAVLAQGESAIVFKGAFELSQAVPSPAVTPASITGAGVFFFNSEDNILTFQVALTDLTSSVRALQFHNAPASEIGPPIQTICGEGPAGVIGTPLGSEVCKSGTNHVMQTQWTMTDGQVAELLDGRIYVNVHTEINFAPGEIRAQLNRM